MKNTRGFLIISLLIVLSSCVGNKQSVLFQNKDEHRPHKVFLDEKIAESAEDYLLKSNDVLFIRFEKFKIGDELLQIASVEQQSRNFQVSHPYIMGYMIDEQGDLFHPLVGKIKASDKSLSQFRTDLSLEIREIYPGSTVEVYLMNNTITVLGEVSRPGRYPVYKEVNTISDAIATAGDFMQYADRKNVKIIRRLGDGTTEVMHIDLTDVNALSSSCNYLRNDDIIVVSPLPRKKYATANIQWLVSSVTALVAVASLVISITR